ncbi:hypothetical protein [Mucilaginibacter sp. SG564]|uniref:hypothetical protein n=1 Tax=Mucilaginibacter sp. SG564 TaxID=2587022 RepID=UPI0015539AFA|nr:hypothetical protein [Mucilaginibacter sp. SG564]NOW96309.1 hypothetical protein [Mucilaginibacter sp. SG564]
MASQKDKDYHKLRNPEQYSELSTNDTYGYRTKEGAEAHARYKAIWNKYGFKSMVSDKRRRNSTRKSNQKNKQILHQIERSQNRNSLRVHLIDQDNSIGTKTVTGKGYVFVN